jgi:hypothetical protein
MGRSSAGLASLVVVLLLAACGDRGPAGPDPRNNQVRVIQPYFAHGTWVFDDRATGLEAEPFVEGIPEMIDRLVADIPDAKKGFRLTFSHAPFPGHELVVARGEPKDGGHYYTDPASGRSGWLCPALFKYFREAPEHIYVKADAL